MKGSTPLDQSDRQWLTHYQHPVLRQNDTDLKGDTMRVGIMSLEETWTNAEQCLNDVIQDSVSISQTLKLTDDPTMVSSSLRWYVYPKEVVSYLLKLKPSSSAQHQQSIGNDDYVPGTLDRENLLGPIRPIAWYGVPPALAASQITTITTPSKTTSTNFVTPSSQDINVETAHENPATPHGDKGQKSRSSPSSVADVAREGTEVDVLRASDASSSNKKPTAASAVSHKNENSYRGKIFAFRDGEHTGEALWEELAEGVDDGELSEECMFYDPATGAWTSLSDVVAIKDDQATSSASPGPDTARSDGKETSENCITESVAVPSARATTLKTTASTTEDEFAAKKSKESKKPSRDPTTWGKGNMVTWDMPTAAGDAVQEAPPSGVAATEAPTSYTKRKRHKHIKPPGKLMRLVTQAMIQWDMLEDGDRLLLGLSGGKDSLSLLHVLLEFQAKLPIKFEIEVCTIDPMTPSFDPSPLIPYVESLGLKYHYIRDDIVARANQSGKDGSIVSSLCSFCARMKRGNLYTTARRNNCNKLVLAQHLDDLAESFLMSVMHNGFLRTMKANYKINAGDLSVIRPLVYCRESLMTEFAKSAKLPIINENCPACFEEPKERARVKKLLSREETLYPNFYDNIKRCLLPLMHDDCTAILRSYTEEALAKSRKEQNGKKKGRRQQRFNGLSSNSRSTTKGAENETPTETGTRSGQAGSLAKVSEKGNASSRFSPTAVALTATVVAGFGAIGLVCISGSKPGSIRLLGRKSVAGLFVAATGLAASRLSFLSVSNAVAPDEIPSTESSPSHSVLISKASEEELVRELAKRRAERFRLAGAMKRLSDDKDDVDPTGQVCTLNGGDGSIPCRELME